MINLFVFIVVFWIFIVGNERAFCKKSSYDSQHRLRAPFHKTDSLMIECVRRQQPRGSFSASHFERNYWSDLHYSFYILNGLIRYLGNRWVLRSFLKVIKVYIQKRLDCIVLLCESVLYSLKKKKKKKKKIDLPTLPILEPKGQCKHLHIVLGVLVSSLTV